jgi:hypothetical protein
LAPDVGPQLEKGNQLLFMLRYIWLAVASWRQLLRHLVRVACSRALPSVGSSSEISTAMMPITTSSSTSVKAEPRRMRHPLERRDRDDEVVVIKAP